MEIQGKTKITIKLFFLVSAAAYFFWSAADRQGYHFFDNVDLAIHEAGHLLFLPLGESITVAGGTILQLAMPLLFVVYFLARRDIFSASIISFWLGQSLVNVARYAADAAKMELPLLGPGMHDWNYLLSHSGLLFRADLIAGVFYYSGVSIMLLGSVIGALDIINDYNGKN